MSSQSFVPAVKTKGFKSNKNIFENILSIGDSKSNFMENVTLLLKKLEKEFIGLNEENEKLKNIIIHLQNKIKLLNAQNFPNSDDNSQIIVDQSFIDHNLLQKVNESLGVKKKSKIIKLKNKSNEHDTVMFRVLGGHNDIINSLANDTSCPTIVLSASLDKTVKVWNIETGKCLLTYSGHNGSVNDVKCHAKDGLVCSVSGDCYINIWKHALHFSIKDSNEENDKISADSGDHMIKLKNPLNNIKGHDGPISACDWLVDPSKFVTSSWDRTSKLWTCDPITCIQTFTGHELELTGIAAHPIQSSLVATCSRDCTFRVWDLRVQDKQTVNVCQGHSDIVSSVIFIEKQPLVLSSSYDQTVKVWDMRNMRNPITIGRFGAIVNRISLSFDNITLAVPEDNRHFQLFDIPSGQKSRVHFPTNSNPTKALVASCWLDNSSTHGTTNSQIVTVGGFNKKIYCFKI